MRTLVPAIALLVLALAVPGCGARSELRVDRNDPLVCSRGAYSLFPGGTVDLTVGGPPWAAGRLRWSVVSMPTGAMPMLTPGPGFSASFSASVEGAYTVRVDRPEAETSAMFRDGGVGETDNGFTCLIGVNVRARGPQVTCPADVSVRPRETARLTATASADRGISAREWTLVSAPASSGGVRPDPRDQLSTTLVPDVAGDYRLRLTVTDSSGEEGRCEVTVHAVPTEALRVELFWNPPSNGCNNSPHSGCDPTDVDLHLLHASQGAWFSDNDCYYANCNSSGGANLEWDSPGSTDNPHLDLDDVTGFGPENINVDRAGSGSYRIGVHFFAGHGRGDAEAHVLVYCGASSTPVETFPPLVLHGGDSSWDNEFWIVADVVMRATGCEVRPIQRNGTNWVFTAGEARSNPGPAPPGP